MEVVQNLYYALGAAALLVIGYLSHDVLLKWRVGAPDRFLSAATSALKERAKILGVATVADPGIQAAMLARRAAAIQALKDEIAKLQ